MVISYHFFIDIILPFYLMPAALTAFLETIDLKSLRRNFASPERILESAFLRREIAERMHERLALMKVNPRRILDAGCAEGADLFRFQSLFPKAGIVALDASLGLLSHAKKTINEMQMDKAEVICGNFARLPFAFGSFDMLWSNLALHWYPDPEAVFLNWKNILSADGMLLFSCFGPQTLSPLRKAFEAVDAYHHILPFMEMHDLGDCLVNAGFPSPILDREIVTVTYSSAAKCLQDIRAFGGNVLKARRRGLMGKKAYQRLIDYLESEKDSAGKIRMPYEIIYGHAFCTPLLSEEKTFPVYFHQKGNN